MRKKIKEIIRKFATKTNGDHETCDLYEKPQDSEIDEIVLPPEPEDDCKLVVMIKYYMQSILDEYHSYKEKKE